MNFPGNSWWKQWKTLWPPGATLNKLSRSPQLDFWEGNHEGKSCWTSFWLHMFPHASPALSVLWPMLSDSFSVVSWGVMRRRMRRMRMRGLRRKKRRKNSSFSSFSPKKCCQRCVVCGLQPALPATSVKRRQIFWQVWHFDKLDTLDSHRTPLRTTATTAKTNGDDVRRQRQAFTSALSTSGIRSTTLIPPPPAKKKKS